MLWVVVERQYVNVLLLSSRWVIVVAEVVVPGSTGGGWACGAHVRPLFTALVVSLGGWAEVDGIEMGPDPSPFGTLGA